MAWFRKISESFKEVEDILGVSVHDLWQMPRQERIRYIKDRILVQEGQSVWVYDGEQMLLEKAYQYTRMIGGGSETTTYYYSEDKMNLMKEEDIKIGGPANNATFM